MKSNLLLIMWKAKGVLWFMTLRCNQNAFQNQLSTHESRSPWLDELGSELGPRLAAGSPDPRQIRVS